MIDVNKLLSEIDDYFNKVTPEEFDKALDRAGYGVIEPASKSGYEMIAPKNMKEEDEMKNLKVEEVLKVVDGCYYGQSMTLEENQMIKELIENLQNEIDNLNSEILDLNVGMDMCD